MAHYTATLSSPWAPEKAFDFVADFRNFEEWDPSVTKSVISLVDGPGVGTVYAVTVKGATLDYVTMTHDAPTRAVIEGTSTFFYSYDVVTVAPTDDGCTVTYDATLKLRNVAAILNPLLGLFFDRLGDAAATGLAKALDATTTS